jgi:hypothetical protein
VVLKIKRLPIRRSFIALLVMGCIISLSSCSSGAYKTFSIKEGPQPFTVEYPPSYKLIRIDMNNSTDSQYTTVGFASLLNGHVSEIYIYVWPTSPDMNTASTALDSLLSNASGVLTDYNLDKKVSGSVNGRISQGAYFTASQSDATVTMATGPAYYRVTCLIQGTWIIELDMTCSPSIKESTQADYDHLIETFTVLR